ncbi:MAG: hypothetical protein ACLP3K_11080 [Candidatus Acidiferrales bacterium]
MASPSKGQSHFAKTLSGMNMAVATNTAQAILATSARPIVFLRAIAHGTAGKSHAITPTLLNTPTIANIG